MAFGTVNVGQERIDQNVFLTNEKVGVPLGLATLDANGKLSKSQQPELDAYTKQQTDNLVTEDIAAHNEDSTAHGDIRASVDKLDAALKAFELKFATDIKSNPFNVTFTSLTGVIVTGVWNAAQGRIEF